MPDSRARTPLLLRRVAFLTGLGAGVAVTRRLHEDEDAGIWGRRLGPTNLRYANLPVGGTIAIVASLRLPAAVATPVRALGIGATLGAVGWGMVDPLDSTA